MITLHPTKRHGATAQPGRLLYVDPGALATEPQVAGLAEVNTPFLFDVLSAKLAHTRCGRHLYRSVAGRSANPVLVAKYETHGAEAESDVESLEEAVTVLGGNPCYVSPAARAVEAMDTAILESTFMLGGSLDPMTVEMAMLDAVLVAETMADAQRTTLAALVQRLDDGPSREVLEDLVASGSAQVDRLEWARDTKTAITAAELASTPIERAGRTVEQIVARVHNWLS